MRLDEYFRDPHPRRRAEQPAVFGELAEQSDLGDLLALCSAMGLEVVSLRRLPGEAVTRSGTPTVDEAGSASA
jgi:hypothetical protein